MKNLLKLTVVAAFGVIALTACKKDWTCDCTYNNVTYADSTMNITKASKDDAQSACNARASQISIALPGTTCTAKAK